MLLRLILILVLLAPLATALPALQRGAPPRPLTQRDVSATAPAADALPVNAIESAEAVASRVAELPHPLLGFAINAHHISDLPRYLQSVDAIAELGANTLIVLTPMYQRTVTSTDIRIDPERCATDDQLVAILARAHARGLATVLMPIVLLEDPGPRDWRGVIAPRDWDAWWASYDGVIDRVLAIAERTPVDMLSIGSELNSTESRRERWARVAQRVRARFDGPITYSANWDRYPGLAVWDVVDVMSVSSYFELLPAEPGAAEDALVAAWAPYQRALLDAAAAAERPLMLSEVGYPTLPWANAHPWNYVAGNEDRADPVLQARCWRAFFRAWGPLLSVPRADLLGFCGYRWDPYHRGEPYDTGYGIVGKPAYEVLRSGFAAIRGDIGTTTRPIARPAR